MFELQAVDLQEFVNKKIQLNTPVLPANESMVKLDVFSASLEVQAAISGEKQPFIATVTFGGRLSDHCVGGTEVIPGGPFRVKIPTDLLSRRAGDLEGKRVFAADDLISHAGAHNVGTFVDTWCESVSQDGVMVLAAKASGFFDRKKNEELVDQIIQDARAGLLGFSYDLKEVGFQLKKSEGAEEVFLEATDFKWRGATVLRRDAAAYHSTQLAARKINNQEEQETENMEKKELDDLVAKIGEKVDAGIASLETKLTEKIDSNASELRSEIATQKAGLEALTAKVTEKPTEKKVDDGDKGEKGNKPDDKGQEVPVKDFFAQLGEHITTQQKPLVDSINKLVESLSAGVKEEANTRKSVGGEILSLVEKYPLSAQGTPEDVTSASIQTLIDQSYTDDFKNAVPRADAAKLRQSLGLMKRTLQKQEAAEGGAS
jgi:hypothetical protein